MVTSYGLGDKDVDPLSRTVTQFSHGLGDRDVDPLSRTLGVSSKDVDPLSRSFAAISRSVGELSGKALIERACEPIAKTIRAYERASTWRDAGVKEAEYQATATGASSKEYGGGADKNVAEGTAVEGGTDCEQDASEELFRRRESVDTNESGSPKDGRRGDGTSDRRTSLRGLLGHTAQSIDVDANLHQRHTGRRKSYPEMSRRSESSSPQYGRRRSDASPTQFRRKSVDTERRVTGAKEEGKSQNDIGRRKSVEERRLAKEENLKPKVHVVVFGRPRKKAQGKSSKAGAIPGSPGSTMKFCLGTSRSRDQIFDSGVQTRTVTVSPSSALSPVEATRKRADAPFDQARKSVREQRERRGGAANGASASESPPQAQANSKSVRSPVSPDSARPLPPWSISSPKSKRRQAQGEYAPSSGTPSPRLIPRVVPSSGTPSPRSNPATVPRIVRNQPAGSPTSGRKPAAVLTKASVSRAGGSPAQPAAKTEVECQGNNTAVPQNGDLQATVHGDGALRDSQDVCNDDVSSPHHESPVSATIMSVPLDSTWQ